MPIFFFSFLAKLNQTIESVSLVTFVPIYLYVNIPGQFHNGDSYSKIEVLLHECLFIELTYEILIQNDASTCRKFKGTGQLAAEGTNKVTRGRR